MKIKKTIYLFKLYSSVLLKKQKIFITIVLPKLIW